MADLTTTTLLVGLAVALAEAVKYLAKALTHPRNGNRPNGGASGQQPVSYWELKIGEIMEEKIQGVMAGRNEEIRKIFREELNAVRDSLDRRRR